MFSIIIKAIIGSCWLIGLFFVVAGWESKPKSISILVFGILISLGSIISVTEMCSETYGVGVTIIFLGFISYGIVSYSEKQKSKALIELQKKELR